MTRPRGSEKIYAGGCYALYSPFGYNSVCLGVGCDIRFNRGDDHSHIEITLCDKCLRSYKSDLGKKKKTKRQRLEAICNEAIDTVYRRITR